MRWLGIVVSVKQRADNAIDGLGEMVYFALKARSTHIQPNRPRQTEDKTSSRGRHI